MGFNSGFKGLIIN